ncbi:hypothetical protein HYPSUDRAFT_919671 [Hypholoma sublateritium FD-334 SS-4]|uniref:Uncharacterized protein n=1 Tax=Hypholoma sublateritium (strain FD-334 SS-4) TaxID=945553 RepID=A0A0D2NIC7_HYPSF|nr:hypothetical protein HYPSUDRAFT_919671 [Hypholoma sublateritium FD-334 SS-4]
MRYHWPTSGTARPFERGYFLPATRSVSLQEARRGPTSFAIIACSHVLPQRTACNRGAPTRTPRQTRAYRPAPHRHKGLQGFEESCAHRKAQAIPRDVRTGRQLRGDERDVQGLSARRRAGRAVSAQSVAEAPEGGHEVHGEARRDGGVRQALAIGSGIEASVGPPTGEVGAGHFGRVNWCSCGRIGSGKE